MKTALEAARALAPHLPPWLFMRRPSAWEVALEGGGTEVRWIIYVEDASQCTSLPVALNESLDSYVISFRYPFRPLAELAEELAKV